MTPIDENTFQEAAKETAQNIANTWERWYQSMSDNNTLFSMPSDTQLRKTSLSHTIEPVSKTYQIENQQQEMNRAGLSSTELPFSSSSLFETQNTQTDIDLPQSLPPSLDPNSPAYITQLYEALGLNGNNYAHLDPEILAQLKDLLLSTHTFSGYQALLYLP